MFSQQVKKESSIPLTLTGMWAVMESGVGACLTQMTRDIVACGYILKAGSGTGIRRTCLDCWPSLAEGGKGKCHMSTSQIVTGIRAVT